MRWNVDSVPESDASSLQFPFGLGTKKPSLLFRTTRGMSLIVYPVSSDLSKGGHSSFSLVESATTLLPRQDKPAPSGPTSGASCFVVSCGVRWSEVGLAEFRKPQVAGSIPLPNSTTGKLNASALTGLTARTTARLRH